MAGSIILTVLHFSENIDLGWMVVVVILSLVGFSLMGHSLFRITIMSIQAITLAKTGIVGT